MDTVTCQVNGMSCSSCSMTIAGYLEKKGMKQVMVSLATGEVSFQAIPGTDVPEVLAGIDKLGYSVVIPERPTGQFRALVQDIRVWFFFCAFFTLLVVLAMWLPLNHSFLWQGILATPVFLAGIWHFGGSAWAALKQRIANMDLLVITGASAAYGYSLYGLIARQGMDYRFFDTAAVIITLVLLGNWLERGTVRQTASAIHSLAARQSTMARRFTSGGHREEVDSRLLVPGDEVQVNTGDQVPRDGRIIQGQGSADESMISGESFPVLKEKGSFVIGGSLLVEGSLRVRITATGKDTVISRIIDLVIRAQNQKTPMQRLADRISAIFVPTVLLIALAVFLAGPWLWHLSVPASLLRAIAILVVACPCAMGLATPAAVMVGLGRAARLGILIRGADTLERFRRIKTIVFDKTGTLTSGNLRIRAYQSLIVSAEEFKSIVSAMELHSSHPLARSIAEQWHSQNPIQVLDVEEIRGSGLRGKDGVGRSLTLGSRAFTRADLPGHDIYLVIDGQTAGWVDLEDEMRPEVPGVIAWLRSRGIRTILLSGDRTEKCRQLAERSGIQEIFPEHDPAMKLDRLNQLMVQGPVAMVGDGINDAPALAAATIGISLSDSTDVARQAAAVVLMNHHLGRLPMALDIGHKTYTTIRENLFWALFYNVIAIPVAAAGLLHPMICAAAMGLSDLFLVGNSIRLNYKKLASPVSDRKEDEKP